MSIEEIARDHDIDPSELQAATDRAVDFVEVNTLRYHHEPPGEVEAQLEKLSAAIDLSQSALSLLEQGTLAHLLDLNLSTEDLNHRWRTTDTRGAVNILRNAINAAGKAPRKVKERYWMTRALQRECLKLQASYPRLTFNRYENGFLCRWIENIKKGPYPNTEELAREIIRSLPESPRLYRGLYFERIKP